MDPQANKTRMVSAETQAAKQWIKVMRPVQLTDGTSYQEGSYVEVSAKEAKEFCDKKFQNVAPFTGERLTATAEKAYIVRAVRVSEEEAKKAIEEQSQSAS